MQSVSATLWDIKPGKKLRIDDPGRVARVESTVDIQKGRSYFDSNVLFEFNKAYGSSPLNFIPDEPVKEHLSKLKTGQTIVWAAFNEEKTTNW